ncbi:DNA polymerase kappa-like [Littorina saxatilis]|uniref:DNA polymerase kappa-like n=1 Tax=Littorina saxatilis TaxID=31220 RepID=UPI0038B63F98
MNYYQTTDEDENNSETEDWMDTNWDSFPVQDRSNRNNKPDGNTEPGANSKGAKPEEGSAPLFTRMQLNDHKAGMQGLDKERINQIIFEVSKGSKFFENERKKEEQVQHRIQEQEKHRRKINDAELQKGKTEADIMISQLCASRDLTQSIVHVDMDAFYAAVAMRDNPSLRDKPMAVGGIGMLSTSNYEARKYGVRAAMPGFIGKKLCPQLVLVPLNFPRYNECCHQVREVFADYDPNFCPMSLDEAYLNFTEHLENRQQMSVTERSVIKRCQSPADAALCQCDLNVTIGMYVLKEESSQALSSESANSLGDGDINANTEKIKESAGGKGVLLDFEADTMDLTDSGSSRGIHSSDRHGSSSAVTEVNADAVQIESKAKCPSTNTGNTSRQDISKESVAQNNDGKTEESSTEKNEFESVAVEAGSPCHSCGKAIPKYEVVPFGRDVESAVHEMRCCIEQRTCLTASAGIASNMMLSKVCSDRNKPNGQFYLPANLDDIMQFVHNLPIRKIAGIGRVTEQLLGALGISTCKDMFEQRALLYHLYSSVSFSYFMRVACGIGSTQVASAREEERKSMSTEQTFGELSRPEELYSKCQELCQCLAEDLAKEQLMGKTVSLKLKTTDFQVRTRAQTTSNYVGSADDIFAVAKGILRAEILAESPKPLHLRLMGVRLSKLMPQSECSQEKQDTILGFFKKASVSTSYPSPAMPQQQSSTSVSADQASVPELSPVKLQQQSTAGDTASVCHPSPQKEQRQDTSLQLVGKGFPSELSPRNLLKQNTALQPVNKASTPQPSPMKALFRDKAVANQKCLDKVLPESLSLSSVSNPYTSHPSPTKVQEQTCGISTSAGKHREKTSIKAEDLGSNTSDSMLTSVLASTVKELAQDSRGDNSGDPVDDRENSKTEGKIGSSEIVGKSFQFTTNSMQTDKTVSSMQSLTTGVDQEKTKMDISAIISFRNEASAGKDNAEVKSSDSDLSENEQLTEPFETQRDNTRRTVNHTSDLGDHALTSVGGAGTSYGASTSTCAVSQNRETHHAVDSSFWFTREPAFTCPVCSKPVNCINLTDFNAHIDKCLQSDSQSQPLPTSATSKSKQLASSQPTAKPKSSVPASKSGHSTDNQQTYSGKKSKNSSAVSKVSSSQATTSKASRTFQNKSLSKKNETTSPHRISSSTTKHSMEKLQSSGLTSSQKPNTQTSGTISTTTLSAPENSSNEELDSTDYMVCPLCCAERADWTLETFNQHVDTCLNRDTISKILQEQRISDEQPRKRPASSQKEDSKNSQQGKKLKKSKSPRPERSILSFFKT